MAVILNNPTQNNLERDMCRPLWSNIFCSSDGMTPWQWRPSSRTSCRWCPSLWRDGTSVLAGSTKHETLSGVMGATLANTDSHSPNHLPVAVGKRNLVCFFPLNSDQYNLEESDGKHVRPPHPFFPTSKALPDHLSPQTITCGKSLAVGNISKAPPDTRAF